MTHSLPVQARHLPRLLAALLLAMATPMAAAHQAPGHHDAHAGGHAAMPSSHDPATLRIEDCWVRPLPAKLPAAAYLRVVNAGTRPVTLSGARAPGFGRVMLHATETRNGMAAMVHVHALPVPAGGTVAFSPGGHHVMLEKPAQTLAPGDTVELTLVFDDAPPVATQCEVKPTNTLN